MDRSTMVGINRGMGIISVAIGLALVTGASIFALRYHAFIETSTAVPARVVANAQRTWTTTTSDGTTHLPRISYCAVVEYSEPGGVTHRYQDADLCMNPPSFQIGQVVTLRYDPGDDTRVHIDRGNKIYLAPLVVAVVGALCILGGVQRLAGQGMPVAATPVPIIEAGPSAVYRNV
jgi:hypothetical protein